MTQRLKTAFYTTALGLLAAACGSSTVTKSATGTTAVTPSAMASTVIASTAVVSSSAFPVTIEHKYGSSTIKNEPKRVVSVGFTDQDWLLALGVQPVGVREWFGDKPYATWEWAADELGSNKPTVLGSAELNFEAVAALKPDLIVGLSSAMSDTDYATLSKIAPTVAQPKEFIDFGTPWDVTTEVIAKAVGRVDEGKAVIARVKGLFAAARAAHPEFAGKTAAVSFFFDDKPGAYASQDSRSRVLTDLGFTIPAKFDELAGSKFFFSVSAEQLAVLDANAVVWIVSSNDMLPKIAAMPLRPSTKAFTEGREVVTDAQLSGAFSFGSPLSLEYLLAKLVPDLALAVDGKPETAVPSAALFGTAAPTSTTAAGPISTGPTATAAGPALNVDQQAASDAFSTAFDSTVTFEAKSVYLAEPDVVRGAAIAYGKAGSAMDGIRLRPTAVVVEGDAATITYDVLFGGTAAYQNLSKTIGRTAGQWVVPTKEFCAFLSSARVPCP